MFKRIFVVFIVVFMGMARHSYSQVIDNDAKTPQHHVTSSKAKEAEKKKEKRQKDMDKAEKQLRKDQVKIQSKETRKRMKKSKKEAERNNAGAPAHKGFLKGLFSKKKY